jgi:hypothetical protein
MREGKKLVVPCSLVTPWRKGLGSSRREGLGSSRWVRRSGAALRERMGSSQREELVSIHVAARSWRFSAMVSVDKDLDRCHLGRKG